MNEILYINACVREGSRTDRLAECLLKKLDAPYREVKLKEITFPKADEDFLKTRDRLVGEGRFDDPLFTWAREFSEARIIVIAAPFWDLSFPAALKQYFEQINVPGITFAYSAEGTPISLCKAEKLFYITTAGGPIFCEEYGFGYVKALAQGFYHIPQIRLVKAEGLDIDGADVESILRRTESEINQLF